MPLAHVLTIASYGCALDKSTYCLELAKALAESGRSVLMIDASPSTDLSNMLEIIPGLPCAADMILGQRGGHPKQYVRSGERYPESVSVIPGHPKISQIEQGLRQNLPDMDPGIAMVAPIQKLRDMYDYILIDAPAQGVEPAVLMALSACDKVVIVEPSSDLLADVSVAQTETNAKLQTVMADHLIPSSLAGNLIDEE